MVARLMPPYSRLLGATVGSQSDLRPVARWGVVPSSSTTEKARRFIGATRMMSPCRACPSIVASAMRVARNPPETSSVKVSLISPMASIYRAGF